MGAELPPDTVFVTYDEVKDTVGSKKVLKIFLVDKAGNKHLAATGEDLGDAHYAYRSTKPFTKYGRLICHNRNELHIWLEMVISESGGQAQAAHLGADEQNPEGIYFVAHRYERAHYPDGRRCNRWYLMDQHGESHLAVIGIERDNKDGHYQYSAEEPFASIMPLQCSNQAGVYKWLEKMVTHHAGNGEAPAPAASFGGGPAASTTSGLSGDCAGAGGAAAGSRKPPLLINLADIRAARKSTAALESLEQCVVVEGQPVRAKPKPKAPPAMPLPLPAPTTQKHKSVGIVQQNQIKKARKLQEDLRAEEEKLQAAHLARLRRAAAAEMAGDTAAKATTLGWLHSSLSEEEAEHLDHCLALLRAVLDMQHQQQQDAQEKGGDQQQQSEQAAVTAEACKDGGAGTAADAAAGAADAPAAAGETGDMMGWIQQPANRRHHLRVALECLKELGAQDLPARVLLSRKVIPLVQRCLSWPHQAVSDMAQHMLRRWRWQLAGHMHVLGCPAYMEDHLGALEEDIQAGRVPLPQLPKHKQALLHTPIPKLPLPNAATPAPAKHSSYSNSHQQQLLQQAPASAPPALSAVMGMQHFAGQQAGYGAQAGPGPGGFTPHPMGSLTPDVGMPGGFYTPMGAAAAAPGMMPVGGGLAGLPGMKAAAGTPAIGSMPGTGARRPPGMAAAAAAGSGGAAAAPSRLMHSAPGNAGAAAAAGRLPAGTMPQAALGGAAAAAAAAGMYGQQAQAGYVGPAAAAMYGGGWVPGQGMQAVGSEGPAGPGMAAGAASGSSTDLAAMAAAAAAAAADGSGAAAQQQAAAAAQAQQQQQQLALFAMQQQQMRMMNAGIQNPVMQQMQYAQMQQQQHTAGAAAAALNPQQQQQLTMQWQQQQQQQQQQQHALYWQQQQHMQAVWASGQGAAIGLAQQQQQQTSSQGYMQ